LNQQNELIEQLKINVNNLKQELTEERNKNRELINQINNLKIQLQNNDTNYNQILIQKQNELNKLIAEINELKSRKNREITSIKPGEKIISINFVSTDKMIINYSRPCKTTDLFVNLEEKLNEDFPQLKDKNYYMANNGQIIKRFKTVDENNIKDNDIISIIDYSI